MVTLSSLTPEEFLAYEEQHDDTLFNFADGEVIAVEATIQRGHSAVEFMAAFRDYLRTNPIGTGYGRVLHVFGNQLYQPDVCVHSDKGDAAGYFTTPPLVAVEIRTEPLTKPIQRRKALAYLANGTPMVIAVFPGEGLEVYRPDHEPVVLSYGDVLDGDDVLPGFNVKVDGLLGD